LNAEWDFLKSEDFHGQPNSTKQKLDTPCGEAKKLMDWSWYFADFNIAGWYWLGIWANCIQRGALRGADLSCLRALFARV
jgi:hypothetical protein